MSESDDKVQDEFQEFLKSNKIDFASLKGTPEEGIILNAKEKRMQAILRAVHIMTLILLET
jgi:hypothetical protein